MKHFSSLVAACLSTALLAACASSAAVLQTRTEPAQIAPSGNRNSGPTLYVAESGGIGVYSGGGASMLRKLRPKTGLIATDALGHLFLGVYFNSLIDVFANRGAKLVQKYHPRGGARSFFNTNLMVADASGNLYVRCAHYVCEYDIGNKLPVRKIPMPSLGGMGVDGAGNLYLGDNFYSVDVFPPGSTTPQLVIKNGIAGPEYVSCDRQGNVYVVNTNADTNHIPSISEYAPGSTTPIRSITQGVNNFKTLTVDSTGNLYILNLATSYTPATIEMYAPGSLDPIQLDLPNLDHPAYMALDSTDSLYVANSDEAGDPGNVTVYEPLTQTIVRTVTHDIKKPWMIVLGP